MMRNSTSAMPSDRIQLSNQRARRERPGSGRGRRGGGGGGGGGGVGGGGGGGGGAGRSLVPRVSHVTRSGRARSIPRAMRAALRSPCRSARAAASRRSRRR